MKYKLHVFLLLLTFAPVQASTTKEQRDYSLLILSQAFQELGKADIDRSKFKKVKRELCNNLYYAEEDGLLYQGLAKDDCYDCCCVSESAIKDRAKVLKKIIEDILIEENQNKKIPNVQLMERFLSNNDEK